MLMGLKEGQEKMSKSDPDSAIFMEDTEADLKRKIKKAFCPPEIVVRPSFPSLSCSFSSTQHPSTHSIRPSIYPPTYPSTQENNPIVDYVKSIIFGYYGKISISFHGTCPPSFPPLASSPTHPLL